jgi:DNA-binding transcriptional ArsR family regulator
VTEQIRGLADLERLDAVFGALAHRTRRAILVTLLASGGSQTSGKIAGQMDHSWQTTSRHLRLLEEAGLISVGLRGRERVYTLEAAYMTDLLEGWVARFGSTAPQRDEAASRGTD